jgi:hypothetical protein
MTWGRLINGVKYIHLMNDNEFKKKSLEDNIYFTLRDIFANADSADTCFEANYFNGRLTGGICFEERTERFEYTNELHQKYYVERLQRWLKHFDIYYFEFTQPEEDDQIDMKEYMKWDDWWNQFIKLRKLIDEQYEKCLSKAKRWEEEEVGRDMDRYTELEFEDECLKDPIFGDPEVNEILDGGPGF